MKESKKQDLILSVKILIAVFIAVGYLAFLFDYTLAVMGSASHDLSVKASPRILV